MKEFENYFNNVKKFNGDRIGTNTQTPLYLSDPVPTNNKDSFSSLSS